MRELTTEEKATLQRRRDDYPRLVAEMRPGIAELAEQVGYADAVHAADDLERFLPALDRFLKGVDPSSLTHQERVWLDARLAYVIGELLVSRHGGYPDLQADPESDFFLHYVVGGFEDGMPPSAIVEPFIVAHHILDQPSRRGVAEVIEELEARAMGESAAR